MPTVCRYWCFGSSWSRITPLVPCLPNCTLSTRYTTLIFHSSQWKSEISDNEQVIFAAKLWHHARDLSWTSIHFSFPFFRRFCKIAKSFVMSVRVEQLCSHWMNFHEIWYVSIFWKSVSNIKVSLKSDKNDGYFTWRPTYIFDHISLISFLEWELFQTKAVEKIETQILYLITLFRKSCRSWD